MSDVNKEGRKTYNRYPWNALEDVGDSFVLKAPKNLSERQALEMKVSQAGKMWSRDRTDGKARFVTTRTRQGIEVIRVRDEVSH